VEKLGSRDASNPFAPPLAFSITVPCRKREGIGLENKVSPGFPFAAPRTIAIRRFLAPLHPVEHGSVPESQTAGAPSFPRDINFSGSCAVPFPFFLYLPLFLPFSLFFREMLRFFMMTWISHDFCKSLF